MALTTIYPNGTSTVNVPATESIAISNYGGGIASIYYLIENANRPDAFQLQQTLENAGVVLGAFAAGKTVKIEAGRSTVVYDVGASPDTGIGDADTLGGNPPSYYATDSAVTHLAGIENISGQKTFEASKTIFDNDVGVGTDTPKDKLHIYAGDSGQSSSHSSALLTLEDDTNAGINILTPSTTFGSLLFGDEGGSGRGGILYTHTGDILSFLSAGVTRMSLASNGTLQMPALAADPGSGEAAGQIYYNTTSNVFRFYNGSAWANV